MGKKRIIQKTQEELIKEEETIGQKMKKEVRVAPTRQFRRGRVYVYSTYNNTIITLADSKGDILFWRSAGSIGFKGTKKGTSFAASRVASAVCDVCDKLKIKEIEVFLKGVGSGRDSALKTLAGRGLEIEAISDVTPIPHNGCRPKKARRV